MTRSNDAEQPTDPPKHLLILGGGSAAFAAATRAVELGAGRVTLVNDGLPIGGTCVNVGCVPSKTLIRAAESLYHAQHSPFDGIEANGRLADYATVVRQKRELVGQLRQAKYLDVVSGLDAVRIVRGRGRLSDARTIEVNGERIVGDRVLIATGAAPFVPAIPGMADSGRLTNDTLYELEERPESLLILGGRYIALENAQMMARFGVRVTVLQRSNRILPDESPELTGALTGFLRDEGVEVVTGVSTERVERRGDLVTIDAQVNGETRQFAATHLLAATGRRANTHKMGLEELGVQTDERGFVHVDATGRTSVAGIFAAGDVIGEPEFVYTAAYEGALAVENAWDGGHRERDYSALPWVIFTDPQVAGVGLDERQAKKHGFDAQATTLSMANVPRALAARDTRGFLTLIRDRGTDKILGARVLAPDGSELLPEISLAMRHGITASQIRENFHAYLTLGESIKLAAITFGKDVGTLSCCAT